MRLRLNKKNITIGVIVIYSILFLWFANKQVVPFGIWSTSAHAKKLNSRISEPFPDYRVSESKDGYLIKKTPVYFEVNNPRKFDQAKFIAYIRGSAPIVYAGVVKNDDPIAFEQYTLYHKYIEELDWDFIEEEGFILFQKENKYNSIKEFIDNPPNVNNVAVLDANAKFRIPEYGISKNTTTYDVSLRGNQNIFVYTGGEDIFLEFSIHDVNRHDGTDEVSIAIHDNSGNLVFEEKIGDDGIEWGTQENNGIRVVSIERKNPVPGVYKINFSASDDVFIRKVKTGQAKMVWKGSIYLGDEVGYTSETQYKSIGIWSNGQGYGVVVPHPESIQKVVFQYDNNDVAQLDMQENNKQYEIHMQKDVLGNIVKINIPKRDMKISANGFFSLSKESFFIPKPLEFESDLDMDKLGINFVFAKYKLAKDKGKWRKSFVNVNTYDIEKISPLKFFIGSPHGQQGDIEVKYIKFKLSKPAITIGKIINKIW